MSESKTVALLKQWVTDNCCDQCNREDSGNADSHYFSSPDLYELAVDMAECVDDEIINGLKQQRDALLQDRSNAISQMSKSWQWNEEKKDDLITRYVAMSNKQFAELDKLKQQRDDAEAALAILEFKFDKLTDNKPKIPDGLMLSNLKKFQAWRLGEDERSLEEIGLTPKLVTATLDWAIEELEGRK